MESKLKSPPVYSDALQDLLDSPDFTNWKWQQRNVINTVEKLVNTFPSLSANSIDKIHKASQTLKVGLTPYYASLISFEDGMENDPLWRQVVPKNAEQSQFAYDSTTENWEVEKDMINPIAQKKYDNRVIIRLSNVCHSYCQFCYEALRTLEKDSNKDNFQPKYWADTVSYIETTPEIEEIILSGGEPLMLSNEMLTKILRDIRQARPDIIIRIHTRSLTFNPYRIDQELVELFQLYQVAYIGIHITHPNEMTPVFFEKVRLLQQASILFANIPLLKGINDDVGLFKSFCMELYKKGVLPHYLYHFMPFSPGSTEFKTTVSEGMELIKKLKRHISNLAVPEYVLPHHTGKYTVPITYEKKGFPVFDDWALSGKKAYEFVNWQQQTVEFPI